MQPRNGRQRFIPSCIICIDMLNKVHRIFYFRQNMICLKEVYILREYGFGIEYVNKIMNDSTQCVQNTNMNPIKLI